jgi:hypothetical protein
MPGIRASLGRRSAMTWSALSLRSPRGLSSMNMNPLLMLLKPPVKETMCATAGCESTTAFARSCRAFMAGKEMSSGASEVPASAPVSCWGKSPLGTTAYR